MSLIARWILRGTVGRAAYFFIGAALMVVKVVLDSSVAAHVFHEEWTLTRYVFWPTGEFLHHVFDGTATRAFPLTMLAISIPFIVVGVAMTAARLRSVRWPLWLTAYFFFPVVNLFFIAILCVQPPRVAKPGEVPPQIEPPSRAPRRVSGVALARGIAVSGILGFVLIAVATLVLREYGLALFVGTPFVVGMAGVWLTSLSGRVSFFLGLFIGAMSTIVLGVLLLGFGVEGGVCIVMAMPLFVVISALGSIVAVVAISESARWSERSFTLLVATFLVTPLIFGAELIAPRRAPLRVVSSSILVHATPEEVWAVLIAFPPIPAADGTHSGDWLFRAGIACPLRAEIEGSGVGAIRRCIFDTGPFVEPIDVWDEPKRLAFSVATQPAPMREWSPYSIHPPHIDSALVSHRGEFELIDQGDGTTLLRGTTWYHNSMWPQWYWGVYSDTIIHRIHMRVLEHIGAVADGRRTR